MVEKYKKLTQLTDGTGYTLGFSAIHNPTTAGVTAAVTGRYNEDNTTLNLRVMPGEIVPVAVKYVKPVGGNLVGLL